MKFHLSSFSCLLMMLNSYLISILNQLLVSQSIFQSLLWIFRLMWESWFCFYQHQELEYLIHQIVLVY
jgi:hypothetical protein